MTVDSPLATPEPPKTEGPNLLARVLIIFGYMMAVLDLQNRVVKAA